MNNAILIELAKQWEHDAITPECQNGAADAAIDNAVQKGQREAKRECADTLRILCSYIGDHRGTDKAEATKT